MDMNAFIEGIDLREDIVAITADDVAAAINVPMLTRPEAPSPWNPRLPFDIALGEDQQILCDRYNLQLEDLEGLYYIAAFRREIANHQKIIREEGVTFRQKAKVQAEMYLDVLDDIVNNVDVSAATRLDAIKSIVKWGDLEPKVDKAAQSSMPQFNIQINL
jgi:hypothetical protein